MVGWVLAPVGVTLPTGLPQRPFLDDNAYRLRHSFSKTVPLCPRGAGFANVCGTTFPETLETSSRLRAIRVGKYDAKYPCELIISAV